MPHLVYTHLHCMLLVRFCSEDRWKIEKRTFILWRRKRMCTWRLLDRFNPNCEIFVEYFHWFQGSILRLLRKVEELESWIRIWKRCASAGAALCLIEEMRAISPPRRGWYITSCVRSERSQISIGPSAHSSLSISSIYTSFSLGEKFTSHTSSSPSVLITQLTASN